MGQQRRKNKKKSLTSPAEYIRGACELHLSARVTLPEGKDAINRFLSSSSENGNDINNIKDDSPTSTTTTAPPPPPRLFIWLPIRKKNEKNESKKDDSDDSDIVYDDDDDDDEWDEAFASTDAPDGMNRGALAFINSSAATTGGASGGANNSNMAVVRSAGQVHCMTLVPRMDDDEEEDEDGDDNEEKNDSDDKDTKKEKGNDGNNSKATNNKKAMAEAPGSGTFLSLQLYARHCFVPAVRAVEAIGENKTEDFLEEESKDSLLGNESSSSIKKSLSSTTLTTTTNTSTTMNKEKSKTLEGLEDRLRELDVALGQCRRASSGGVPHVILRAHPIIARASEKLPFPFTGKIDLDELGLSQKLSDDNFLNQVQGTVTVWITQIQKVTVLPSSSPFPEIDDPSGDNSGSAGSNNNNDNNGGGADLEEVSFWLALESALKHIRTELERPSIVLTVALLRSAKRFVATVALDNNTGLDGAETRVNDITSFLKHYPSSKLASARDIPRIYEAVTAAFEHLPRVRRSRYYDLGRTSRLLEATTSTLSRKVETYLRSKFDPPGSIAYVLEHDKYETDVRTPTLDLFMSVDSAVTDFKSMVKKVGKTRGGDVTTMEDGRTPAQVAESISPFHVPLRERLERIYRFRVGHERLRGVVIAVLQPGAIEGEDGAVANSDPSGTTVSTGVGGGGAAIDSTDMGEASGAVRDVEAAPSASFAGVDALDLSPRGKAAFERALATYDRRVDGIEGGLARLLRDKLAACEDAEAMFRVFARFNPLLSRPRVRSAVKDFQARLVDSVGDAVSRLRSRFASRYESSPAASVARLRGIPPISGKILWAKQVERRVKELMRRMGDVLGPNWGQQLEGRGLRRAGEELLSKLDARSFLRSWVTEWEREMSSADATRKARLNSYPVRIVIDARDGKRAAVVNYEGRQEELFREVRFLNRLGFGSDVPRTLFQASEEALLRYPHAVMIGCALRSYTAVRELVSPELEALVAPELISVRDSISETFGVTLSQESMSTGSLVKRVGTTRRIRWEAREMSEWAAGLTELVTRSEERVETLLRACDSVDVDLKRLSEVPYDSEILAEVVRSVQKTVDELSLAGYAELRTWVDLVDERMGTILKERLENALDVWCQTFKVKGGNAEGIGEEEEMYQEESKVLESENDNASSGLRTVEISSIHVEILLRNQVICTQPSLPTVRSFFLQKLHEYIGVVCSLPRPSSGRFELFESSRRDEGGRNGGSDGPGTFDRVVHELDPRILANAYSAVEEHMFDLSDFVGNWLSYQVLWDTRVVDVANDVGEDIHRWHSLLIEADEVRGALDATESVADFGPVLVKYDKVQSQINLKYDSWQRELQSCYASVLGVRICDRHEKVNEAKARLEAINLEGSASTTHEVVIGATFIQEMKQNQILWKDELEELINAEKLLKRQRHTFRSDWIEGNRLIGQFQNMEHILTKRCQSMDEQMPLLQSRVLEEDKIAAQRTSELLSSWDEDKPLRGNMPPTKAMEILTKYEFSLKKAKLDEDNLIKAKDALQLESTVGDNVISDCLDETHNLKEVWEAIIPSWTKLDQLKMTSWTTAIPRKIKKELEDISVELRVLSNRIRQYDAYINLHDTIKSYLGGYGSFSDLKTEALKERHWSTILTRLGIRCSYNELTVGMLWDHGLNNRKNEMEEILATAQGEMALEVFLSQVRDRWIKQEMELVLYQNRVRLIKGWDDLFTTLDDHMGGLILMKSSPYYRAVREFQEEGNLWEERLSKIRGIFDSWVDVQRRWVYLEGILFGSSDIKAQLPTEWSRFKSVDGEFVGLMRRISGHPYAMETLNIDNLQRTLDRLGNLMNVIQRALGDYLGKQRSDFSRFYFLGDDDLLEIIGNSGEPGKVLSHVAKMFAGISGTTSEESFTPTNDIVAVFDGMVSKDGEVVPLEEVIKVSSKGSVIGWLKQLEDGMQTTLATFLHKAIQEDSSTVSSISNTDEKEMFVKWAKKFPGQVMILATLINWSMGVHSALCTAGDSREPLTNVLGSIEGKLEVMAQTVLLGLPSEARKKFEQLITELVHQRDVTRSLIAESVSEPTDFRWLYHLRYTYNPMAEMLTEKLCMSLSNANFFYGFEYLGIGERLVQTPLTDRCYLTLTQALHFRMGGNPFGPAGTGKTESVKALGAQLGRFVVVMNCDEAFDFGAMGRIFCGLCQVGAWGCFDEFNRLEERILSAVSQQILNIQRGLVERKQNIELLGQSIRLHQNVGIFVTMNPGYAGRSNLPDNLKALFRGVAMVVPDRKLIAQVMLYSQGIVSAQHLSGKIVDLFLGCQSQMSSQSHYDFGLRALKPLLVSAGGLKRRALDDTQNSPRGDELFKVEERVLIESACNNLIPKLVASDLSVFSEILRRVFPGSDIYKMENETLRKELANVCKHHNYVMGEEWMQKVLQLNQVLNMRHGVMLIGQTGSGKSSALKVLLEGIEKLDGIKGEMYVIDPKAMNKEALYGVLDGTTMDWTDGVFTSILRKILANQKGEADRRHWIVFDGDVDPEWAENLNSVLDDNKLLTLPSGERLSIPNNLRIILEIDSLEQATPATVSRCGLVYFGEDTVSVEMCLDNLFSSLLSGDFSDNNLGGIKIPAAQTNFLTATKSIIVSDDNRTSSIVADALDFSLNEIHIMPPTRERLLQSFKALLIKGIQLVVEYDENHLDFPMSGDHIEKFAKHWILYALLWSFTGSCSWSVRLKFADFLVSTSGIMLPSNDSNLSDYRVRVEDGDFELWSESVPRLDIESHKVTATDVVITTNDTVRHTDVLSTWLLSRMPLILCGPPGSGKTMTLTSVLQSVQGIVMANLNFSSGTTPALILKTFDQYCTYVRKGKDIILEPSDSLGAQTWLVVFCDEINLPENDLYGTQRVIMFIRQLVEQGGFWRDDNIWIKTNRIQFVGACNPPADAGRVEMSSRFLRHAPLLLVDFPVRDSLVQIYGTFNAGMMKLFPNLKGETEALTEAMVEVYTECQTRFTPEIQPQYFYSPRELSRWVRGVYEAIVGMDQGLTREELVRIWAHEALRLFCDRLVDDEEKVWCEKLIDDVAKKHFTNLDYDDALARPLYYSSWLSKDNRRVGRDELTDFIVQRLRVFYEEELNVPLVIFDEVLDHVLRIDRVLRQPMGHCLLVGDSGAGKTVLSKFVSWMNGLSIFQIKAHSRYGLDDFNEDLRSVMRRVGIEGEKICFIFDESNALGSGFIEAMNALLASGEVPGLFEGDEFSALMNACRDSASREGIITDSEDELYKRFTKIVQRNLHVIFTMNPSGGEWKTRSTTSPALFNRCVVDWFGTWSSKGMGEVGKEFTLRLDMGDAESVGGTWGTGEGETLMDLVSDAFEGTISGGFRQAVVGALVDMHNITKSTAEECAELSSSTCRTFLSPRDYLALIQNFVKSVNNLREEIEDEQLRVNAGLSKLRQTQENVAELKIALGSKKAELRQKEELANNKLLQMVGDQKEAETRKEEAEKMSVEVESQQKEISIRKEGAQKDLDSAEPALLSAQAAVKSIKKRDLDEVRNLGRPPKNVQLTLECVAIMLGEKNTDWKDVKKLLGKKDFIPSIINFDVDKLTKRQTKIVQDKYLAGNPELTIETVTRSSKACGPLYKWAESQVTYSAVYNRVQPLRDEVKELEKDAEIAEKKKDNLVAEVSKLESSIAQYKTDYAKLIRDVEALKTEMEVVTTKVDRAEILITSLSQESDRWSKSSEGFQVILRSIVGDGLLMACFLTYSGFFAFRIRLKLVKKWRESLDKLDIEYREDLSMIDALSTASERLRWQSLGLQSDSLSLENGVILDHCVRFPLIIDPSGDAINFLMNKFKDEKIQKTSFLDSAFMKTLAGAIRFGTTLLVENVENIDPVLNPILNQEIQRSGGRSIVRIGSEEVDYSPKFKIILTTKNPAARLTPDICSRVTLVNFTVTPASLQSKSVSIILKAEKPDVEKQRINVLKLQSEQKVKLKELEIQMLAKISAVEGNILDDTSVVEGMEVLMKEGAQVEEQISKSADIMKQVHSAVNKFEPFSALCKDLFVLLQSMREINFLYNFSPTAFTKVLDNVLCSERSESESDEERLVSLKSHLFNELAARCARGLYSEDQMVLAVLLSYIQNGGKKISRDILSIEDITSYINENFGSDFAWQGRGLNHLKQVTQDEIDEVTPLMLCSAPGHDVSGRVEAMALQEKIELSSVAMGSEEGFISAEKLVATGSKRGTWVMLKNCHLCIDWLQDTLVKKLHSLGPGTHKKFRLFITSEITPKLPTALMRLSDIIVAEAPTGVKSSMFRFFSSIASERFLNPVRNRLYLALGWTHAVIQERLRFVPLGWSESYEFTENDALHALNVIDSLLENGKHNNDPAKLPWDAIHTTLCKDVFGGRVTQDSDQIILSDLVTSVFTPNIYDVNFNLVKTGEAPPLPDGNCHQDLLSWIDSLPSYVPPTWIGLATSAESTRSKLIAQSVVTKIDRVNTAMMDQK